MSAFLSNMRQMACVRTDAKRRALFVCSCHHQRTAQHMSPACCTKTCPARWSKELSLRKNMTREPCLERHPKHEMSLYKHVRKTSIQAMAPGPLRLCNCSAFIAMSTKCSTFGTTPKHVASCGYVEKQDKFASWDLTHGGQPKSPTHSTQLSTTSNSSKMTGHQRRSPKTQWSPS